MNISSEKSTLIRKLGLFDSVMIMVGIIIGSGIFITTGIMAQNLPSPLLILLAWITGGVFTLAGALTYAELGAAMPVAGGQYVYLKEAYWVLPRSMCICTLRSFLKIKTFNIGTF